ncbi:hypothetical protein EUGRSUZ_A01506 [Eucalyptus grandis]|uniref:Uncharacterized protein n=2 Tax=Eucalyptus grandis TaxID=71139 RepID=A0ACC3M480_EUCGR|nr:hypothetical protein EUGRSUZ_A01506 [Eucalyptus grandis]
MALVVGKNQPNHLASVGELEDEEDDLFEINLDAVDKTPPPNYFWDDAYCFAAAAVAVAAAGSGTTRFANCLLPVEEVSSAVPAKSSDEVPRSSSRRWSFADTPRFLMAGAGQPLTLGKLLELPFSRALIYDDIIRGI